MLFEDFLNRYISTKFNRLAFPSIIFPWMIILGLFMMITSPLIFLVEEVVLPNRDRLFIACYLTGLGLFGGSIFTGCFWGLMKERLSEGYLRPNFGSTFFLYVVLMVFCWFHVWFFAATFFYNYPSQRYRSFILEVKPSPELKAEIENLGLYEIKSHTPYDYSLEKQVVRYDFLERKDNWTFESREDMFRKTTSYYRRNSDGWNISTEGSELVARVPVDFPEFLVVGEKYACGVYLATQSINVEISNSSSGQVVKLEKIKNSQQGAIYDVTSVFYPSSELEVCRLRRMNVDENLAEIIITQLLLPEVYKGVLSVKFRSHRHWDFGLKHFKEAIGVF